MGGHESDKPGDESRLFNVHTENEKMEREIRWGNGGEGKIERLECPLLPVSHLSLAVLYLSLDLCKLKVVVFVSPIIRVVSSVIFFTRHSWTLSTSRATKNFPSMCIEYTINWPDRFVSAEHGQHKTGNLRLVCLWYLESCDSRILTVYGGKRMNGISKIKSVPSDTLARWSRLVKEVPHTQNGFSTRQLTSLIRL
ncbi:hypothetical protein P389DRAFT_169372 [Cystobasidium minutum MCA 4210]|uniref:uncharacterized protein n=1 Tax=Cystobasidium minutum MCA 4210 TaxID=1397322 RepID=UPI0034CEF2BB|eukprot:jgi/Rhomi1/169372/fgenesh1_kg.3_\